MFIYIKQRKTRQFQVTQKSPVFKLKTTPKDIHYYYDVEKIEQ